METTPNALKTQVWTAVASHRGLRSPFPSLRISKPLRSIPDCCRTVTNKHEPCPVDWKGCVAELLEEIEFGLAEGLALVEPMIDQVLVEALHEGGREDVVGGPEAGEDGFGAGQEEGSFEAGDAFLAEESAVSGVAGGERDQVGTEGEVPDLADLEEAVFIRVGGRSQDECCPIRELLVGHSVDGQVDDSKIGQSAQP